MHQRFNTKKHSNFYRYEKFLEHSKTTHPMGRVGTADEVGKIKIIIQPTYFVRA